MSDDRQSESRPRPSKAVRRTRRVLRVRLKRVLTGVAVGLALLVGVVTVLTRTPVCKVWLLPAVSGALGLDVRARSATVLSNGTVVLEDAVFIIPGVEGTAGRFMEVRRLEVDLDPWRAGVPISRMRLDGAVLRVSQATDSDRVNLQMWELPGGGSGGSGGAGAGRGTGARPQPPRVDLRSATIELGEHGPGTGVDSYRVLKSMVVRGFVVPTGQNDGAWAINLHEADPADPDRALRGGIGVTGRIDEAGVHLSMTEASLSDWPASAVPSRHRRVFEMLAIEGDITRTFLELPWEGEVAAGISLSNVAMTLPFEPRAEVVRASRDLGGGGASAATEGGIRLTRSGGTIAFIGSGLRATLDGWIEDLPFSVTLDYRGLSSTSPFVCELRTSDYHLSQSPALVPFLPKDVFDRLADFRAPTGLVDAQVVIEREAGTDGAEGPTRFSGKLQVREGRAAFNAFPYPFEDMRAEVSFDENQVRLERITGVSASGARLSASGVVAPLGDLAGVTIRVTVTGAPVDERMLAAMGPVQAPIIESIFSRGRMAELEAAGLVVSPQRRDALLGARDACQRRLAELSTVSGAEARSEARRVRGEAAEIERALRAPVFGLGGLADVTVVVDRLPDATNTWSTHVEVQLSRAGVVPSHFPMPIEATDVRLVIDNRHLRLERGQFRPLSGGTATVGVEALLPGNQPGEESFEPKVSISATGVPVDRVLLHAAAHAGDDVEGGSPAREGASWLSSMRRADLVGTIDAEVSVGLREPGRIGFDASATFEALRAAPEGKPELPGTISVQAGRGRLTASEAEISFAFEAEAVSQEASGSVSIPSGRFGVTGRASLVPDAQGRRGFEVTARGQDVLTQAPIERVVGLVSPEGERALADLRERYRPTGSVHGTVEVRGGLGEAEPSMSFELSHAAGLEVNLDLGRAGLAEMAGTLRVSLPSRSGGGELAAESFEAVVTLDGVAQGRLGLDGRAELLAGPDRAGAAPELGLRTGGLDLRVSMEGGRLESPLTRGAIAAFVPDRGRDILPLDPWGGFDGAVSVRRAGEGGEATFEGEFHPHSLAATIDGQRVEFHDVSGTVRFDGRGGRAEGIRATGAEWTVAGDAAWTRSGDGQLVIDATVSADAAGLTPGVLALVPAGVRRALSEIGLSADGAVSLTEGVVHASLPAPGEDGRRGEASVRASGAVRAGGVSASVGLPIAEASGTVWFEAQTRPGLPGTYTLNVACESLRAAGLRLDNARARVSSGEREGEVLVPLIEAGVYGGRLAGHGRLTRVGRTTDELKYDLVVQMSGVRFATLLSDREGPPGVALPAPVSGGAEMDASRGLLAAEVSLGGVVGRDSTRRGRGSIQVGGGPVVSLPLLMPVIEVANLRLPASTPLDVAFAEFYVLGDTVTFEELSAFTPTVEIWGYGTLEWSRQRLDLRFNTRSTSPIPVVSELLEGVRNELVSTRVGGTLAEPDIDTIQFSGTRRVLDTLLGDGPDEQQRRLTQIGERARLNRSRALRAGERLRWLVASQMEAQEQRPE